MSIPTEREALAQIVTAAEAVLSYYWSHDESASLKVLSEATREARSALDGTDYKAASDAIDGYIGAEVHTDDRSAEFSFNAVPWFAEADASEILALQEIGWGGNYEADAVAHYMADLRFGVAQVLDATGNGIGFECNVNENDAIAWLKDHRPDVYAELPGAARA